MISASCHIVSELSQLPIIQSPQRNAVSQMMSLLNLFKTLNPIDGDTCFNSSIYYKQ